MDTTRDMLDEHGLIMDPHPPVEATLDALSYCWGDAYETGCDNGEWWYRRRDRLATRSGDDTPSQWLTCGDAQQGASRQLALAVAACP